jgi:hypothetical protein
VRKCLIIHSSVDHGIKLSFREALAGLKKDDGMVYAEDVLRMMEELVRMFTIAGNFKGENFHEFCSFDSHPIFSMRLSHVPLRATCM